MRCAFALREALRTGQVRTFIDLRRELQLGFEELEQILEALAAANVVRKVVGNGWVLIRDPGEIRVAEVFRLFVFRPEADRASTSGEDRLGGWLAEFDATIERGMNATLDELVTGAGNLLAYPVSSSEGVSEVP